MFEASDEAWVRAQKSALRDEIDRLIDASQDRMLGHQPREAVELAREALALAEANSEVMPSDAMLHLGYALSDLYESEAALDCYRLVRDRFVVENDVAGLAHVDMNMAIALGQLGRHDEAVELLERASVVFEERGIGHEIDACRINLVPALRSAGRHDDAMRVGRLAVDDLREVEEPRRLADALTNLAHCERRHGDVEAARVALIEALDLYRKLGLPTEEADCLDALGVIARNEGLLDFAASMHTQAISMYEGRDHDVDQAVARYNLAITEVWRGNHAAALDAARLATGVPGSSLDPAMVEAAALDGLGRRVEAAEARAGFIERQTEECVADELTLLP
ncbi:tetratricopeptide repeat protein [Ilumatobacter coccineus]|uniref:MalT-like TPR region domain-containing protein n=1 Tax=Ilumatobacter coccineus (strain NBRC 103263 / KCTC 29153 / YM16-304) TaxID=1313172 RepID=A0A6C7E9S6_ILUCY|nr:tetratricopeptide repeat protein [Ilumatobacter coccineus]BAN04414.1 hypothetical protein YM304_41000 [Ilumatobacter coccineus YM16-304]